jgi:MFS family permease
MPAGLGGRPFVLLWCSTLGFYLGFQILLPVMPIFAARLGGREDEVGLIIGVFALSAMVLRPVAGALADRLGRRPLVLAGAAIFAASALAYPSVGGIGGLLALRVFHGVGMGLGPTAATTMVTDLAAPDRRGAAMGAFGLAAVVGLAVGPYLGIELTERAGFPVTFAVSAALALAAFGVAWALPETRPVPAAGPDPADATAPPARPEGLARSLATRVFSPEAVYPSLLLLALYFSYGGLVSFLPLFAERYHLGNPGLFFTVLALTGLVVRGPAGHVADRAGRRIVVAPALGLAVLGLAVLALARTPAGLLGAAVLYGIAFGAAQPALMAMTADQVPVAERGRAIGTFYTAWELGISSGSILLGLCAARVGYRAMWGIAAAVAGVGALGATRRIRQRRG